MKKRLLQRRSLLVSLVGHALALMVLLIVPFLFKACSRDRPVEKLMFVDFTVALPPPATPETAPVPPAPEPPPPPPPDTIAEPEKPKPEAAKPKPEAPKPKPKPKSIRQTNRVTRVASTPTPKGPVLSEKEIAALLKKGARIGDTTSIPSSATQAALGAYFNHVYDRMYAVWQQPEALKNLPGLRTTVCITVGPDGRISARRQTVSSGNALMDDSVMKAVNSVKTLRALPPGHTRPVDIDITFELTD